MGMLDLAVTFSFVQLLIDNMIVDRVKKLITTDCRVDGNYDLGWLSSLTGKGFPAEFHSPHMVRGRKLPGINDLRSGRPNIIQNARHKVESILQHHKPEPLPPFVREKIRAIILEAEERKVRF